MAKIVTGEEYMSIDGKFAEIKRQLRQKGGYPFDPAELDAALQRLVEGRFPGTADWQALKEMIAVGRYDRVATAINADNFPARPELFTAERVKLFCFGDVVTDEQVVCRILEAGCVPAVLEQLLAYGVARPDEQRQYVIAALGSSFTSGRGNRLYPCLYEWAHERCLGLSWDVADAPWVPGCRFLAFRRKTT